MGRKYSVELSELLETYVWTARMPIDSLAKFAKRSAGLPLYVVGSGGSFSVAAFASELHQHTGTISKPVTPLEFLELDDIDNRCTVLIVTAGGNNKDILSAFDRAVDLDPEVLGVLCASASNRVTHRASQYSHVLVHAAELPKRDGFLATNSLLAMEVWLVRAYAGGFSSIPDLPDSPVTLLYDGMPAADFGNLAYGRMQELRERDIMVVLHDGWGRPAAIDIESKLTEAGLVSVSLADYRNFAHGRHNWLDKNVERTGIVALVTPACATLATKSLDLIPRHIPRIELRSGFNGPAASLNLLMKCLYAVRFFGDVRGIDPGRPQVAPFGRKLYHLTMPKNSRKPSAREYAALVRKFPRLTTSNLSTKILSLRRFVKRLESTRFYGIVLDYDGTICDRVNRQIGPSPMMISCLTGLLEDGISIGIATGRGKSVRKDLQRIIPKEQWNRLLIGYYNGSVIGYLDDNSKPDNNSVPSTELKEFFNAIQLHGILPRNSVVKERPMQISIRSDNTIATEIISAMNVKRENPKVKVAESDHSTDLLPGNTSKINLIDRMWVESGHNNLQILCIGDKGRWPGNDYEMLRTQYSLSVDEVSEDSNTCWNILPKDIQGESGVLEYLKGVQMHDGYFMLNLGVKK